MARRNLIDRLAALAYEMGDNSHPSRELHEAVVVLRQLVEALETISGTTRGLDCRELAADALEVFYASQT